MQITVSPTEEIKKEVERLLQKHNIEWNNIKVWETSDGYLVEIESPNVGNNLKAIELSDKLEDELKFIGVSIAIIPQS